EAGPVVNCAKHRAGIAVIAATVTAHKNIVTPGPLKGRDAGIEEMFGLAAPARRSVSIQRRAARKSSAHALPLQSSPRQRSTDADDRAAPQRSAIAKRVRMIGSDRECAVSRSPTCRRAARTGVAIRWTQRYISAPHPEIPGGQRRASGFGVGSAILF